MAIQFDNANGVITISKQKGGKQLSFSLSSLGWDLEKNCTFGVQIPCFTGGLSLPVDLLIQDDNGQALALVLTDFPLEDEGKLRTIADCYSNSAKRHFGQRPAVYFVTGDRCKSAHSLLGGFQRDNKLMKKDVFREFIASHNIQETVVFQTLLEDKELTRLFLSGKMDSDRINQMLSNLMEKAGKVGYGNYYDQLCPTEKDKKSLPKQAVFLAGLGEETYIKFTKQQIKLLREALETKSRPILRRWMDSPVPQNDGDDRLLEWAFSYYGWNRETDIRHNVTLPCYLEPAMELLADEVFLDPKGKPILLVLRDTLGLSQEKAFITAEFYARSFKAVYGIVPFVIFHSKKGSFLKMGAMSGGFERTRQILSRSHLAAQVACVNITEHRAWNDLMEKIPDLQRILNDKERFQQQMAFIQESVKETNELLKDTAFLETTFAEISADTALPEEQFWKRINGENNYLENRRRELSLIRTVVADKRIAADQSN